jgi:hypothetical protein
MYKNAEKPPASMKTDIYDLQFKQWARDTYNSLAPWELTDGALVAAIGRKILAMQEKSVRQLDGLLKQTYNPASNCIYEVKALQVGITKGNVSVVEKTILPLPDKILYFKEHCTFELPQNLPKEERSLLEELVDSSRGDKFRTIMELLAWAISYKNAQHVELLKEFEKDFKDVFLRKDITLDKLLDNRWEVLSHPNNVAITKNYVDRVKTFGDIISDVHTHSRNLMPSPVDIFNSAGPYQQLEWSAILFVDLSRRTPELPISHIAVFHSDIEKPKWLRRMVGEFSGEEPAGPIGYPVVKDFAMYARAQLTTWKELKNYV